MSTCLWGCLSAHEHVPTALLTPTRQDWKVSYRQCHSFTITNTSLSETSTCKWRMKGLAGCHPPADLAATNHAASLRSSPRLLGRRPSGTNKITAGQSATLLKSKDNLRKLLLIFLSPPLPKRQSLQFILGSHGLGRRGVPQTCWWWWLSHRCHFWSYEENSEMFIRTQIKRFVKLISPPIGKILTHASA